ncbi:MAG: NADH-quinone oxidoreductase subunit A [Acidilobaceae archaeon]
MVLDLLYSDTVRTLASVVILPLVAFFLFAGLAHLLYIFTSPREDIVKVEKFKNQRYESGNPPVGRARSSVSMQYFGYLVLFLAVEPALVLFALMLLASGELYVRVLGIYVAILAIFIPFLVYGIRESRRVELWVLE